MKCTLLPGVLIIIGVRGLVLQNRYPIEGQNEVVENLQRIPEGWVDVGAPLMDRKLHFRIAVRSKNRDLLEKTLMEISTPGHPRYGQHLKRDELKSVIKPRTESTQAVLNWLEQSGIEAGDIQNDGEWINFYAPVKRAEEMMDTTFKTYQNDNRPNIRRVRSLGYSVPKHIRSHIDMIQPTTRFGQIRPERSQILYKEAAPYSLAAVNTSCNVATTPHCLADLYHFADYKVAPNGNATIGVSGFLEQYARYEDLRQFSRLYSPKSVGSTFDFAPINGGLLDQNSSSSSVEANLDVQYTTGLVGGPAIATTFYSTPGRGKLVPDLDQPGADDNQNEPYLDFFTHMMGLGDGELPQVLTTSYGEDEQSIPVAYAKKVCDMIGQLGTRGVSVIFSSGDTGVGSACQSNDGSNATRFLPTFPASCPYVTSVGGTTHVGPEEAVDFSSGGFSDLWDRPLYQEEAVSGYLESLGDRWQGLYNRRGRGFPDVAAQGRAFRVVDKGRTISVGGTSASAPVFASIVALLNNARLASGKPALGFLNPWIYQVGYRGLNDIVKGGSRGCTGRSIYSGLPAPYVPFASWNATHGWDPVTGHGTPDFEKLLQISQAPTYGQR